MTKRNYSNVAPPLPLGVAVNNAATTLTVSSTTGYPAAPFILSVGRGTATEEVMLCTAKTGTTFTVTRGYDTTTAQAHSVGEMVEHTVSAIEYRESSNTPMTTTERDALTGSDVWTGMFISNSTTGYIERYNGSSWEQFAKISDITTSAATKADKTLTLTASTGLTGGGDLSANRSFAVNFTTSGGSNGTATTVPRSDDARFSDSRTPLTHSHAIADLPAAADNEVSSTKFPKANDSRLSNARTPTAHTHTSADLPSTLVDATKYKGDHSTAATYAVGDVVTFGGYCYRCTQAAGPGVGITDHSTPTLVWKGANDADNSGGTTSTVTIPSNTLQEGDLILMLVSNSSATPSAPSWAAIGSVATFIDGSTAQSNLFARRVKASEVNASLVVGSAGNQTNPFVNVRVYRNVTFAVANYLGFGDGTSVASRLKTAAAYGGSTASRTEVTFIAAYAAAAGTYSAAGTAANLQWGNTANYTYTLSFDETNSGSTWKSGSGLSSTVNFVGTGLNVALYGRSGYDLSGSYWTAATDLDPLLSKTFDSGRVLAKSFYNPSTSASFQTTAVLGLPGLTEWTSVPDMTFVAPSTGSVYFRISFAALLQISSGADNAFVGLNDSDGWIFGETAVQMDVAGATGLNQQSRFVLLAKADGLTPGTTYTVSYGQAGDMYSYAGAVAGSSGSSYGPLVVEAFAA